MERNAGPEDNESWTKRNQIRVSQNFLTGLMKVDEMKKAQGSAILILILIIIIGGLVYFNYLGGSQKAKEFQDNLAKMKCPDIPTNLTCEWGIDLYKDANGCSLAKCKTKEQPEHLPETGTLQVFFVDVGEGDGIYIRTPTGKQIIIDAGSNNNKMENFLAFHHIVNRIDWLIATHPDADHIGGMDKVLEENVVLNYLSINKSCSTLTCALLANQSNSEASLQQHVAVTGMSIDGLGVQVFKLLNPDQPLIFDDDNDNSIVIKMVYGNVSFLFPGDCEDKCEDMMMLLDRDLSANILKVSHHGSKSASSAVFLARVRPAYGILSYGDPNAYGHPSQEVVDRLIADDVKLVRTATAGTIEVRTDGQKVEWFCEKKEDCFA